MAYQRDGDSTWLPPPLYDPEEKVITVGFHIKLNGLDSNSSKVIKWDFVPLEEMTKLSTLYHFAKVIGLPCSCKFFIWKNKQWDLICYDSQVSNWTNFHFGMREVKFYVQLEEPGCLSQTVDENLVDNEVRTDVLPMEFEVTNCYVSDSEDDDYTPVVGKPHILVNENRADNEVVDDNYDQQESSDEESEEEFSCGSDFEFDSALESDDEDPHIPKNRPKKIYLKKSEFYDPLLHVGMRFPNKTDFKKVVTNHAIKHMRNVSFVRNDSSYIYAECDVKACGWFVYAQKIDSQNTWVVYKIDFEHKCGPCYNTHNVKAPWLAEKFLGIFKTDPDRSTVGFQDDVFKELGVHISVHQAYRAKRMAIDIINGDPDVQFQYMHDYGAELRRTNPGTTVIVLADRESNKFSHFYICFYALKQAFIKGCRPMIGVDGCHLKGPHKGVLLTAATVDPNDKPLVVAWAVVMVENEATWTWFLKLLKTDLEMHNSEDYTFMSDKQKGLLNAFDEVFPRSNNRFCARHLWRNMVNAGFKGDGFRDAFFKAAYATTIGAYNTAMKELGELDPKVLKWMADKHPSQWSKSHFQTLPKCDAILNNGCENYNKVILKAREKPLLTCLEWMREYNMKTLTKKRDRCKKWTGEFCPVVKKTIDKYTLRLRDCLAQKCDDDNYQITQRNGEQFTVNLIRKTCSCRRYNLTGMPCLHVVSACAIKNEDPTKYVHKCYSLETYKKCFEGAILGIHGTQLWDKTMILPPLPPNFGRKGEPGKPEKARRFGPNEVKKKAKKGKPGVQKLKRKQDTVTCGYCGTPGHNQITCPDRLKDMRIEEAQLLEDENDILGVNDLLNQIEIDVIQESQVVSPSAEPKPQLKAKPKQKRSLLGPRYSAADSLLPAPSHEQQLREAEVHFQPPPNTVLTHTLNIRAPPPFSGNQIFNSMPPNVILTQESRATATVTPFTVDGKKYITLSKLTPALQEMRKGKGKRQKK